MVNPYGFNMKVLLVLTSLAAVALASKYEELFLLEWKEHTLTHNIDSKNSTENLLRMNIYLENRIKQAQHNVEYAQGKVGFKVGVNKFTHMTATEVADLLNGYNRASRKGLKLTKPLPQPESVFVPQKRDVPDEWDWRQKGAVTDVKDQGDCGSCYAFSATGALEGQQFINGPDKVLLNISEQNIIDCSWSEGNLGCDGGLPEISFLYVKDNDGIDSETAYPYTAQGNSTCNYTIEGKVATDRGFHLLPSGSEDALKEAVATVGPISVGIDANLFSFHGYISGVYYDPFCSNMTYALDHGVLVVGYGTTDSGEDYWLVKNSWGTDWGEDGYIRMARNRDNACGIATRALYPGI